MKAHTLALFLQFCVMNHQDIYDYTLPHVYEKYIYYHGEIYLNGEIDQSNGGIHEKNPISKWCITRKVPELYFLGSNLAVGGVGMLLADFDKQHLKGWPIGTADIFMMITNVVEVNAIHSWGRWNLGPIEQQWDFINLEF